MPLLDYSARVEDVVSQTLALSNAADVYKSFRSNCSRDRKQFPVSPSDRHITVPVDNHLPISVRQFHA